MFKIDYRIVHTEFDDFTGEHGFFQINCNGYKYGELYPKELETVMDKVSLYDWFERLIRVAKNLTANDYVALSDVESYNTWIEFRKRKNETIISIVKAEKEQGSRDIAFHLNAPIAGAWAEQVVSYCRLKAEITKKAGEYIKFIAACNEGNTEIDKIKETFEELL